MLDHSSDHFTSRSLDTALNTPQKPKGKRHLRWALVLVLLAVLIGLCWGIYWCIRATYFKNPRLQYQHLIVLDMGASDTTMEPEHFGKKWVHDILARDQILPGKTDLVTIDLRLIRKRLLAYPNIEEVTAQRIFPDTLKVSIRERKPIAFLMHKKNAIFVDASGILFPLLTPQKDRLLSLPYIYNAPDLNKIVMGKGEPLPELLSAVQLLRKVNQLSHKQGIGYRIAVINIDAKHQRLICSVQPFADNRVLPIRIVKGARVMPCIIYPVDDDKQTIALERLELILLGKMQRDERLTFADMTPDINPYSRDESQD